MAGGTFTISNGGVFGSLMGTPIINLPQTAVLGLHAIKDKPVVVNGQIVIRPMMYLALTYDHRLLDGREAVQFLVKVKEYIEDPRRMLLKTRGVIFLTVKSYLGVHNCNTRRSIRKPSGIRALTLSR